MRTLCANAYVITTNINNILYRRTPKPVVVKMKLSEVKEMQDVPPTLVLHLRCFV